LYLKYSAERHFVLHSYQESNDVKVTDIKFVINSWTRSEFETHRRGGTVLHHQQQSTSYYNP